MIRLDPTFQETKRHAAVEIADISDQSGVLHNMSARPYTPVTFSVRPLRNTWVSFTMPRQFRLNDAVRVRLDAAWAALSFTGAALVQIGGSTPNGMRVITCRNKELAANIVLRTRGSLLLAETGLLDDAAEFAGTTVISSDLRLVKWAGDAR